MTNRNLVTTVMVIVAFAGGYWAATGEAVEGAGRDGRRCVGLAVNQGIYVRTFEDGSVEYCYN